MRRPRADNKGDAVKTRCCRFSALESDTSKRNVRSKPAFTMARYCVHVFQSAPLKVGFRSDSRPETIYLDAYYGRAQKFQQGRSLARQGRRVAGHEFIVLT